MAVGSRAHTPRLAARRSPRRAERFFSLYVWHPLAHLSYAAYLLSPMGAELAVQCLGGVDAIRPGYAYLTKAYFLTLALVLVLAFFLNVLLEAPISMLVRYQ